MVQARHVGLIERNVRIFFPIYHETLVPPKLPLPQDFDYANCIGTVFPISRCYVHVLDDPECTEYNSPIWASFLGWKKEPRYYKGEFCIGEYYNVSRTKSLPALYTHTMPHDLRTYNEHGIWHGHYMHVYTRLQGPKRINNWLFARLLWDPELEVGPVLKEYFQKVKLYLNGP